MLIQKKFKMMALISFILIDINCAFALGTSPWTTVTEITQGSGSYPVFKIDNPGESTTGCVSTGYIRFNDVDNSVAGHRQLSTLLAALVSGRDVKIKTIICSEDYPYIDHISIRN